MTNEPAGPTLREILNTIASDVQALGSQTLALARLEVSEATSTIARSAIGLVVSVFIAVAGAGVLVSAVVLIAIALGLPAWAAALAVGTVLIVGGALSALYFLERIRSVELGLKETRESLRETLEWLRLQTGN